MDLDYFNGINKGTMMETLGIEYVEMSEGHVLARMKVVEALLQPYGQLHGGATMAFAESVGGAGSAYLVGLDDYDIRGQHFSADHLHTAPLGAWVYAKATLIHRGRTTHIWNIDIADANGVAISACRLTNFIIPKRKA